MCTNSLAQEAYEHVVSDPPCHAPVTAHCWSLPPLLQQLFGLLVGGEMGGQVADSVAQPGKGGQGQPSGLLAPPHPSLTHRLQTHMLCSTNPTQHIQRRTVCRVSSYHSQS